MSEPQPIRAGGGLLERADSDGPRVAILRRRRYRDRDGAAGDVVLPKGKARSDESIAETALREVEEETGCRGRITGPALSCRYLAHGRPKLATYFPMRLEAEVGAPDAAEVDEVLWLTPQEARERLTYRSERDILAQAYADLLSPQ